MTRPGADIGHGVWLAWDDEIPVGTRYLDLLQDRDGFSRWDGPPDGYIHTQLTADKLARGHYAPVIVRVVRWPDGTAPVVEP